MTLALLPAWASLALSAPIGEFPEAHLAAAFAAGAFFVRGAGCALNDVWDARFDAAVQRTRARPIANGDISRLAAVGAACVLLLGGAAAALHLNACGLAYSVMAVPLIALYPAAKRVTSAPQAVLGLTMNWGVLVGAAASSAGDACGTPSSAMRAMAGDGRRAVVEQLAGALEAARTAVGASILPPLIAPLSVSTLFLAPFTSPPVAAHAQASAHSALAPLYLYVGCALWTVVYDTIYAHQDRRDDARLRLGSTARLIGPERSRTVLGMLAVGAVSAWTAAGLAAGLAWPWAAAVAASAAHLAWQIGTAKWDDGANLTRRFVANQTVGAFLVVGALAGRVMQQ